MPVPESCMMQPPSAQRSDGAPAAPVYLAQHTRYQHDTHFPPGYYWPVPATSCDEQRHTPSLYASVAIAVGCGTHAGQGSTCDRPACLSSLSLSEGPRSHEIGALAAVCARFGRWPMARGRCLCVPPDAPGVAVGVSWRSCFTTSLWATLAAPRASPRGEVQLTLGRCPHAATRGADHVRVRGGTAGAAAPGGGLCVLRAAQRAEVRVPVPPQARNVGHHILIAWIQ